MNADMREVILATIREQLLDDDVYTLRRDEAEIDRHRWSIPEHALDAARARGASLHDVFVAAAAELKRMSAEQIDDDLFDSALDHLADIPLERFGPRPPVLECTERTLTGLRDRQTARLLLLLTIELAGRAHHRVDQTYRARTRELRLDGNVTPVGDVIDTDERNALFTAGLYGETEPLTA